MRKLLSGNEAVALGAHESGVAFASAYPGTPSTEILESMVRYGEIVSQWAPNEKVAYESVFGAAMGGKRALAAMKHVGVNVAADPLFSSSYCGVNGGLVLVSADDPAMHSSQNEQDNRRIARAAKIAMIEPSDSREAKEFVKLGFEISEEFDTPVMLRMTTRICHSSSPVDVEEEPTPAQPVSKPYLPRRAKNVLLPSNSRRRHVELEERLKRLETFGNNQPALNAMEWHGTEIGVVTSGVSYQYVREAMPEASVLKLGLTNPIPREMIRNFATKVSKLFVVEELDPYLEEQIKGMGIAVTGKDLLPLCGELSAHIVKSLVGAKAESLSVPSDMPLPPRPPVMCPGCSHRGVFYTLGRMKAIVSGDIGCYTLGALPPLAAMDSCLCMGAGIGIAQGLGIALRGSPQKIVAVIGDSTFVHSGITGLIDVVYNGSAGTIVILDNGTTAMTGHQDHPATGKTLSGKATSALDIEALCRAVGVKRVRVINPYNLGEIRKAIREETASAETSVIISRAPCMFLLRKPLGPPPAVRADLCASCDMCFKLGCPAIQRTDGKPSIDALLCCGCTLCGQVCKTGALGTPGAVERQ